MISFLTTSTLNLPSTRCNSTYYDCIHAQDLERELPEPQTLHTNHNASLSPEE
jgi:hypothetical protein